MGAVAEIRARVRASPSGVWLDPDHRLLFLAEDDDTGAPLALSVTCTHLGCLLRPSADARWLECPCHGSRYHLLDEGRAGPDLGRVVQGPATEDLSRVQMIQSGARLYLEDGP